MKILKFLSAYFILFCIFFSVQTYGQPNGWYYSKQITISNTQNPEDLVNYQIKFSFDHYSLVSTGKSRSDAADIRFYDSDNSSLNYWIESGINTTKCVVWINIPLIPASSTRKITFYYGNYSAVNKSNGSATFDFFDDFSGSSLDYQKWNTYQATAIAKVNGSISLSNSELTIYSGISSDGSHTDRVVQSNADYYAKQRIKLKVKTPNWGGIGAAGQFKSAAWGLKAYGDKFVGFNTDEWAHKAAISDGGSTGDLSGTFNPVNYLSEEILIKPMQSVKCLVNDKEVAYFTSNVPQGKWNLYLTSSCWYTNSYQTQPRTVIDWIFISKITDAEPTLSIGQEQYNGPANMDLAAYYPFNGNAYDMSGNENNGTVYGASTSFDRFGKPNSAYNFNGISNYIEIPHSQSLLMDKISLCVWIKPDPGSHDLCIIAKNDPSSAAKVAYTMVYKNTSFANSGLLTLLNTSLSCGDIIPWDYPKINISKDLVQDNTWSFLVTTYDGTTLKQYINGKLMESIYQGGSLSKCDGVLKIGKWWDGLGQYFAGSIDDIRIYNRALSEAEVRQLYNLQPVLDSPLNNALNQNTGIVLKWNKVIDADSYQLQVSADSLFQNLVFNDSSLAAAKQVTGLKKGTRYFWRVYAMNSNQISPWSDTWSFNTIMDVPECPTLVSPEDNSINVPTDCTLRWAKALRTEKYTVQVATDSIFSVIVFNDSMVTDTAKKVIPLVYDSKYYWRVKARNMGGESIWSNVWSFRTIISAPDYPYLLQPANNSLNQPVNVCVKWQKIKGADKYHLQVSSQPDFSSFVINDSTLADTSSQNVTFRNNTLYYWRVRAINIGGPSAWSELWKFKTIVALPSAPVLISPANGSRNQATELKLSWNSAQNAESYRLKIFYSEQKAGGLIIKHFIVDDSSVTATFRDLTGLKTGIRYNWQVSSKNVAGENDSSEVWSFTTILPSPISLNAVASGIRKVNLTWTDKSDNESGFVLERQREGEMGYKTIDTLSANLTSYTDSTVELATIYKYRLKAFNNVASSDYSNEAQVTTLTSIANFKGTPAEYALMQNYPNPFNPSTLIRYSLPNEGRVKLQIFNALGQIVGELVNKVQPGGYYEEIFDAGNLPSGIYIYSISVQSVDGNSNFNLVKKMMLVK